MKKSATAKSLGGGQSYTTDTMSGHDTNPYSK